MLRLRLFPPRTTSHHFWCAILRRAQLRLAIMVLHTTSPTRTTLPTTCCRKRTLVRRCRKLRPVSNHRPQRKYTSIPTPDETRLYRRLHRTTIPPYILHSPRLPLPIPHHSRLRHPPSRPHIQKTTPNHVARRLTILPNHIILYTYNTLQKSLAVWRIFR